MFESDMLENMQAMPSYKMNVYRACKYKNKWAVLDTKTNVYYFIGTGFKFCEAKAKELNTL